MTEVQFSAIKEFRMSFKAKCGEWSALASQLIPLQKEAAKNDTPDYPLETPVVYNLALDNITREDTINIIVIGDNPGKDEQLKRNNRYLVGQSGKIAEGFFKKHTVLKTDFRKNAIILNKTPVHTAKTGHLKFLAKSSEAVADLIFQSQIWMAQNTAVLQQKLGCELWLVGYAELKDKGIFTPYRNELRKMFYGGHEADWKKVFVYQHFSMNRFLIDLRAFCGIKKDDSLEEAVLIQKLSQLGASHREEIFKA